MEEMVFGTERVLANLETRLKKRLEQGEGYQTTTLPSKTRQNSPFSRKQRLLETVWDESLHPRDERGRFGEGGASKIPRSELPLNSAQSKVENDFRKQIGNHLEEAKARYRARYGNTLNADDAKELSYNYRKDRSQMAMAVHEPASYLVKQLFKEELAKPAPSGKSNSVLFTAGGAGAGKTSGLDASPDLKKLANEAHIVYDGTLRPANKAVARVDQALAAGKKVDIVYVHRDPVDAMMNGVVPRAERTGRTVPLDEFARQYSSIQESMWAVADRYRGNSNFHMTVVDNSFGKGGAKLSALHELPEPETYENIKSKVYGLLTTAYKSGKISKKVYDGITKTGGAEKEIGV